MASKQPSPEIRSSAFIAAREKCALTIEELAHLACLSKKQIQQIENGGRNAFYSNEIKYVAAKKVAKLIQLDEKEAFDFGPQAELPLVSAAEVIQNESTGAELLPLLEQVNKPPKKELLKKEEKPAEARKVITRKGKSDAEPTAPTQVDIKPALVQTPKSEPLKRMHSSMNQQKPSGKKWIWLLPVSALVVALVQFQPLLQDQLDALMDKQTPVVASAVVTVPPAEAAPAAPPATEVSAAPSATTPTPSEVIPSAVPVVTTQPVCSVAGTSMETYKPPAAGKPGNVIFIRVNAPQTLCVVDADGVAQSKVMDPGLGHSFFGKPPFKLLSTAELGDTEVFFQGFRIRPITTSTKGMMLVQAD